MGSLCKRGNPLRTALYSDDFPYFGDFASDQGFYGVDEVELRERASLAGAQHLDADRAGLLSSAFSILSCMSRCFCIYRRLYLFVGVYFARSRMERWSGSILGRCYL